MFAYMTGIVAEKGHNELVIEHGMALGRVGIPMKMPVVPALVVQAVFQLIEKCRKPINGGVIPARPRIERGRKHARIYLSECAAGWAGSIWL